MRHCGSRDAQQGLPDGRLRGKVGPWLILMTRHSPCGSGVLQNVGPVNEKHKAKLEFVCQRAKLVDEAFYNPNKNRDIIPNTRIKSMLPILANVAYPL